VTEEGVGPVSVARSPPRGMIKLEAQQVVHGVFTACSSKVELIESTNSR